MCQYSVGVNHTNGCCLLMRFQILLFLSLLFCLEAVPKGGRGGGGRGGGWGRFGGGRGWRGGWRGSSTRRSWSSGGGFLSSGGAKPTVYKPNSSGQSQYSSYSRPTSSGRYTSQGGKSYGYRAPGHGTNWGTSYPSGGVGRYKGGLSTKAVGLGVGAGFLGGAAAGAALGVAGTMATYSVYHR